MSNWIHRFFNPHCPECRAEREESRVCKSCEILKQQLETVNYEKKQLMDRLLEKPEKESPDKTYKINTTLV